jgi:hypothetical protein
MLPAGGVARVANLNRSGNPVRPFRGRLKLALCATLASVLLGQGLGSQPNSEARWQQDVEAFVRGLSARGTTVGLARGISSRGQKDFDKLYPVYKLHNLVDAQQRGLTLFWAHDLGALVSWVERTKKV